MNDYAQVVQTLSKPSLDIAAEMRPSGYSLMHCAMGIASEAGEIADCIKKHTIYGQTLNLDNLIEELGDLEFFLEHLRQLTYISRSYTLEANVAKLSKRYPGFRYSNQAAQDRADKQ